MVNLDSKQKELMQICRQIARSIKPKNFLSRVKRLFQKRKSYHGIYLYGSVGRGKTMLMKMFYDEISVSKEIIHFQKFMQDLHIKFHQLHDRYSNKVVQELAANIASRTRVVCMDEFEIKDISDAMIIMRLFKYLSKYGVFIFLTTNTMPDNLYKDGMQRESFLPFIEMIKRKFLVLHLDSDKDYRFDAVSIIKDRVLYPFNDINIEKIQAIKQELCTENDLDSGNVMVFGREIKFKKTHQNILFTNFDELFRRDLGYADYVNICERFNIIVLESVRKIAENETDIITRFINFIDNAYFQKILLFIEIECKPEEIYKNGRLSKEFTRSISRLNEMNSYNYLDKGKNE